MGKISAVSFPFLGRRVRKPSRTAIFPWIRVIATLSLACALFALGAWTIPQWIDSQRDLGLVSAILSANEADAIQTMESLAAKGNASWRVFLAVLSDPRPAVVESSAIALEKQIASWGDQIDSKETRRNLLGLSEELRRLTPGATPLARKQIRRLALQALGLRGLGRDETGAMSILVALEEVIRNTAPLEEEALPNDEAKEDSDLAEARARLRSKLNVTPNTDFTNALGERLFGALPDTTVEPAPHSVASDPSPLPNVEFVEQANPTLLPEEAFQGKRRPKRQGFSNRGIDEDWLREPDDTDTSNAAPIPTEIETVVSLRERLLDWRREGWPAFEARNDFFMRARMNSQERSVALDFASNDARVRKRLAESLPAIPNVAQRMWLKWLSEDEDQSVRAVALATLSTSRDPLTRRQADQRRGAKR